MKLKKLFAGVVAAAMIATMSFPAFAATDGLGGRNFKVNNGDAFVFDKVWVTNDKEDSTIIAPGAALTMTVQNDGLPVTYPQGAIIANLGLGVTSINDTNGNTTGFTVDLPNFTIPGKYTYVFQENDPNVAGVVANDNLYQVTVWALQDETNTTGGNHIKECGVKLAQVQLVDSGYVEVNGEGKLSSVENTYQAGSVTVTKHVTGNMGNKATKFNFKVVLKSTKPVKSAVAGTGDKDFTFTATQNADGFYTAEQTYQLADGETFTISNLPFGVTYTVYEMSDATEHATPIENGKTLTVVEAGADSKVYTVTYTSETGTLSKETKDHLIEASVTNQCGDDTIDTGVILDNAPYILMLAVVAGGAMTLVIKKRREEE